MSKQQVRQICKETQQYYIDRMCDLCEEGREDDASSLYCEIREWITEKHTPKILSLRVIGCD
jgi:hypothetical protein